MSLSDEYKAAEGEAERHFWKGLDGGLLIILNDKSGIFGLSETRRAKAADFLKRSWVDRSSECGLL